MEIINLDKSTYTEHMKENLELCKSNDILFNAIRASRENTKIYLENEGLFYPDANKGVTSVTLSPKTTFEAAKDYSNKQLKIAVLNFANAKYPGGGCLNGARAQEESLCRSSTLYECLSSNENYEKFYKKHKASGWGTSDIIYTPNVIVLGDDTSFFSGEDRFMVDVITCAAPNLSGVNTKKLKIAKHLPKVLYRRINRIFKVAMKNSVDVLILGAFGCGVFNNPPELVAHIMYKLCKKYEGHFRAVEFAVYDPSPDAKNFKAFLAESLRFNYFNCTGFPKLA